MDKKKIILTEGDLNTEYTITHNPHQKYIALGLFSGNTIKIITKSKYNRNLVVAVGDSRYIISKNITDGIMVC